MRGYFGIGIYQPKTIQNLGTLWRSAFQLGASFIFTVAHRYKKQASDTYKTWRHIPLFQYESWDTFEKSRIYDCPLICVEFNSDSVPINDFKHPHTAIYLLGAEDGGLPNKIITKATHTVELPAVRSQSFNVAVAGSLVMYDRYIKSIKQ